MLEERVFRILTLDGGGAKGFYSIGVLDEIEKEYWTSSLGHI